MSATQPLEIRLELARLHWELGEYGEAVRCLERAVLDGPAESILGPRLEAYLAEAAESRVAPDIVDRIKVALAKVNSPTEQDFKASSPIATPTLARLLADQGHADKALAVTTGLLEQNPDDERALAVKAELSKSTVSKRKLVDELSRWLENARRRQGRTEA